MPRTTTLDCPGCPPLRALTFDVLGLAKVVEARSKEGGNPKVVERWGDPDASKCVLATSFDDAEFNPLLAVARKNNIIEMLNPMNGDLSFSISHVGGDDTSSEHDSIVGLHLFKKHRLESSTRSCMLLTCTSKGNASLRTVEVPKSPADSLSSTSPKTWTVCGSGEIFCCKVDTSEKFSLFGGKRVEVNVWDLESNSKMWAAKPPPKNSLGIFTPTWFTSATFLNKDDHRKLAAGTNNHQVRLYDISAQRRPVMSVDFRETPIKAIAEDLDGHTIYIGNGSGDLASIDIRTGKLLGCFEGKCSGSIRSIARHPTLPVLASCGLDSYVRFWDTQSRQLLSAVFLKQHLTSVVFDSNFSDDGAPETVGDEPQGELQHAGEIQSEDEVPFPATTKRKMSSQKKTRKKQHQEQLDLNGDQSDDDDEYIDEPAPSKKKNKTSKESSVKKTKKKQHQEEQLDLNGDQSDDDDDEYIDEPAPTKKKNKTSKESSEKKLKKSKKKAKARALPL